jgi:ribosomal protein S27AE
MNINSSWTLIIIVIIVSTTLYFMNKEDSITRKNANTCPDCGRIYFGIPGTLPPAHPVRWHLGR